MEPLQLPKLTLNIGPILGPSTVGSQPRFLEPVEAPTFPFTTPSWCLQDKPRAISLLDVFKDHELLTTHNVSQKSFYLIGRNAAICEIVLSHCSISRLHAAVIHHAAGATYLVDLGSGHGTLVDGVPLQPLRPTLIANGSMIKFGASSRSYAFKSFASREQIVELVESRLGLDAEELELQKNTMLNQALSYRLELSPRMQQDETMPFPNHRLTDEDIVYGFPSQRKSSADDLPSMLLGGPMFRPDEPARKRSRGQSANSQASTENSLGDYGPFLHDVCIEADEEAPIKRVHFSSKEPAVIPEFVGSRRPSMDQMSDSSAGSSNLSQELVDRSVAINTST